MSRIFKRLRLHGIIERVQGTYKYFATAYGKEILILRILKYDKKIKSILS